MASDKKEEVKETVKSSNEGSQTKVENQFGEASSIDKVNLNNKIISMRSTIKKSKVRILAKLIRHIKDLNRKINDKSVNVEKNKRKHANLVEEMKTIKALKSDTVSRFVLGNTCTFEELNNKGFQSTEARALARFADEQLLKDAVKKFRAEHSDWKSLAAFVQTQSSGRHIKKKNKNKKTEKNETKTNIKAKQIMVSNFVHGKVNNMNSTNSDVNSESNIGNSDVTNTKSSQNVKSKNSNKNEKPVNKDLHHGPNDAKLDPNHKRSDSVGKNSNKEIQNSKNSQNSPNNKSKNPNTKLSVKKEPTQNVAMVVKKINLQNFDDDILIDKTKDTMTANIFGVENNGENQNESLFFTGQDSSVMETEENRTETSDQKKDDDDDDFIVSGNHSMFLSLSGNETQSFRGGSGKRGRMDFHSPHSNFKRADSQGYRNSGYRNNVGRGNFSNRGGREKAYPPTKTFKESKYTPSNNVAKPKLSDKSNFSEEKLHPSWEASRKRKEQAASISVYQGKKTTFDD